MSLIPLHTDKPEHHLPLNPSNKEQEGELFLTAKAVEMAKKALEKRGTPRAYLRLGVRGGGCSGLQYAIQFEDKVRGKDVQYDFDGLTVLVDPKSQIYLHGCTLDYEIKLMQHGFQFKNPNEKKSCGCGESFTV